MKRSIGVNAIINGLKTVITLIFPLITYPYITRVLQVDALGSFNFSRSFVGYFYLLAALGISTYSIREGAKFREDKEGLSHFGSEVFSINIISTLVSYILLLIVILSFEKLESYASIIIVLSISMAFTTVGCEWILLIHEEYFYIAVRTIVFQLLSLILLFLLVKTKEDVICYASVIVISSSGADIVNAVAARKKCNIRFVINSKLKKHLRPILILCANSVATTIYVNSDIVLLGFLTSDYHTGIYTLSSKIYSIVKQVLSAMIIVSIPRLSWLLGIGDKKEYQKLVSKIISILISAVFPVATGLFALGKEIILLISTEEFLSALIPLRILSIALLFCVFTWFVTSCILIPYKKEKIVLVATLIAAVLNLALNFVLIPFWGEGAAALTTVVAEATSLGICCIYAKKQVRIKIMAKDIISVVIGCAGVYFICVISQVLLENTIIKVVVAFCCSMALYMAVLAVLKNSSLQYFFNLIRQKFK